MTLFQVIGLSILHGVTFFIPVSENAHFEMIRVFLGWDTGGEAIQAAFLFGSATALLVISIHDWLSFISISIQTALLRKKPKTYDEKIPYYILMAALPAIAGQIYIQPAIQELELAPIWAGAGLFCFGIPLWFFERWSKKNKRILDWNAFDSFILGLFLALAPLPGAGLLTLGLIAPLLRNYQWEAGTRFLFFVLLPVLITKGVLLLKPGLIHSSASTSIAEVGWPLWLTALGVSFLASWMMAAAFLKAVPVKGTSQYSFYRFLVGLGFTGYCAWKMFL